MRLYITIFLLVFLVACNSDGRKPQNKVIPPARHKVITGQTRKVNPGSEQTQAGRQSCPVIHRKQNTIHKKMPVKIITMTHSRQSDSIRMKNIEKLRISGMQPDFSEPLNRDLLLSRSSDTLFYSAITLSPDRVLKIGFDNDIFDYTDQFYTNGVRFDYVAPAISDNPINYMLLPYWAGAKNYYGLSLVQNLYTPSTTKVGGILYGDRPYAAYLYFGSFKITNDEPHHFRQKSELDLGVIGRPSFGSTVQELFHRYLPSNNEPLGWDYQISTDAVINYNFSLEKGVVNAEHLQLILTGTGALGTLYTNLGGGVSLRIGWFNDYFSDLGIRKKHVLKSGGFRVAQYFFTIRGAARLVAYDATLEGGLINQSSPYTVPPRDISAFTTQSSIGFTFTYGAIGFELEQLILSPEFSHKWWHAWVHIGLLFAL